MQPITYKTNNQAGNAVFGPSDLRRVSLKWFPRITPFPTSNLCMEEKTWLPRPELSGWRIAPLGCCLERTIYNWGWPFSGSLTFEFVFVSHLHLSLFHLCINNVSHHTRYFKKEKLFSLWRGRLLWIPLPSKVSAMKIDYACVIKTKSGKQCRRWNRLLFSWSVFPELDE